MLKTKQLAQLMCKNYPEYHEYEYQDMIRILSETLVELVLSNEEVQLPNLGTFYQQKTNARNVFDFQTKPLQAVESSVILKFKPSRTLTDKLKQESKKEKQNAKNK